MEVMHSFDDWKPPFHLCLMTGWRREGVPYELYAKGYARKLVEMGREQWLSGEPFRAIFEPGHPRWADITGFFIVDALERPIVWHEVAWTLTISEHDTLVIEWTLALPHDTLVSVCHCVPPCSFIPIT